MNEVLSLLLIVVLFAIASHWKSGYDQLHKDNLKLRVCINHYGDVETENERLYDLLLECYEYTPYDSALRADVYEVVG